MEYGFLERMDNVYGCYVRSELTLLEREAILKIDKPSLQEDLYVALSSRPELLNER